MGKILDWANKTFSTTSPENNPYAEMDRGNFDLPGFQGRSDFADEQMRGAGGRGAFTAGDSSFRNDQVNLMDRYRRMFENDDESLAIQQSQRDRANATAQQRSLMASASPSNAAMMARVGSQNIGRADQGISGNAIMGRIAERQGLAGSMTNLAGMGRAQDVNLSQFNAQQQAMNRAQNDAAAQGWYGQGLQAAGMQQQGGINYEGQRTNRFGVVAQQPTGAERLVGGIVGAGTAAAGLYAGAPPGAMPGAGQAGARTGSAPSPYVPYGPGYTPGAFNVPMQLAEGGVVTQPTQAVVGEAGPEAVIPLAKLPDLIKMAGQYLRAPNGAEAAERDARESQAYKARAQAGQTGPEGPPAPYWTTERNSRERLPGPRTDLETEAARSGQQWRAMRESGQDKVLPGGERAMFSGGVPSMSQAQWLQFLRGLGVQ